MKANFIVPFDPITRQTTRPLVDERPIDFVHLTQESDSSVVVQVRADTAVIEAMKADPIYFWLEDIIEPQEGVSTDKDHLLDEEVDPLKTEEGEPIGADLMVRCKADEARTFLTPVFDEAKIVECDWSTDEKGVESVVALHKQTLDGYKQGGLG
jgi:hypothetical protein